MKIHQIYKITNLINHKIYIGKQIGNKKSYLGSGKLIKKAIHKYGKSNFRKEIIEYCIDNILLCKREIFWIDFLNSTNPKIGYNISKGGDGATFKMTKEQRKNVSINHHDVSGINNPMFNKKHSQEAKDKIRVSKIGKSASLTTKIKLSNRKIGENNNTAKLNNEEVLEIRKLRERGVSIKELIKKFGLTKSGINNIIKRRTWKHI